jgi:hypothetical protein
VVVSTPTEESALGLSQPPLWSDVLDRVEAKIWGRYQIRGSGPSSLQGAASALARAHCCLVVALEGDSNVSEDMVSRPAAEAVELVLAVARVWARFGPCREDRRRALADQLRQRLRDCRSITLQDSVPTA